MIVNVQEAKAHFSHFLDRVEEGEVIIVCRHNKPVAEMRAIPKTVEAKPRTPGLLRGKVSWTPDAFAPMSPEELGEFEGGAIFPQTPSK